jgi:hypothetical protein
MLIACSNLTCSQNPDHSLFETLNNVVALQNEHNNKLAVHSLTHFKHKRIDPIVSGKKVSACHLSEDAYIYMLCCSTKPMMDHAAGKNVLLAHHC